MWFFTVPGKEIWDFLASITEELQFTFIGPAGI
jgi:hypothetical protein